MKKLFVLICTLFLIGSVAFAQSDKKVKNDKKEKVELKADQKAEKKADQKVDKKADQKVEKKSDQKADKKAESKSDKKVEVKTDEKVEVSSEKKEAQAEQEVAGNENGAEITFKETNHDFGNIEYKGNGSYEFVFVNTGNEPLILTQPKSSCGCTVPEWPRQPILPGESNVIKVTYKNTDRPGNFNKYVTVFSNALVNKEVKLHIKGTVLAAPTDASPLKVETVGTPVNKSKE